MTKKYHIHTFGCQMNVHDSEKVAGILSEAGYGQADSMNDADVIVLNTCSIRDKAEQKFYSELGRLVTVKKDNPNLKIAVAGCIAQQRGEGLFKRFPYVDIIFGPDNINNFQTWIMNGKQDIGQVTKKAALDFNPEYHLKHLPVKRAGKLKAWVSIMYGCDNFCAYCVVPFTRGRERSRSGKDIFNEISALAGQGFREVTLLGQNVNSYGRNLPENMDFPDLLKMIHDIEGLKRIRFVTSHPRDLSEKLISTMKDLPKLCRHIHLPVQSGSDRILNLMNRGYCLEEYKYKTDMLKSAMPDIAITTDIITGFPGETEEDHQCTISTLADIGYDGIFAFKYSRRPGTKALDLPDHVDEKIKARRLSEILTIQEGITYSKNRLLEGKVFDVLVEGVSETDCDKLTGRTGSNKIVNFYGSQNDIGRSLDVKISEAKLHSLVGEKVGNMSCNYL
ncbi:MAG: tRNA (N6-isopentenyl adenosine(37)-C2)-methylthiotransferase MiaB [Nitrospirae bacterium]|nr:tRNA (N6-isopentenyl adenosine(37)-C2)-methylthiotransferase MiaB [Nitrospirota bacterium]